MSQKYRNQNKFVKSNETLNECAKKMAICKMGSKSVTLGSKVIFLGGNIFIFLSSKSLFREKIVKMHGI
jgi:hypothetical protein